MEPIDIPWIDGDQPMRINRGRLDGTTQLQRPAQQQAGNKRMAYRKLYLGMIELLLCADMIGHRWTYKTCAILWRAHCRNLGPVGSPGSLA